MQLAASVRKSAWWAAAALLVAFLSSSLLSAVLVSSVALLGPILSACLLVVSVTAQDMLRLPGGLSLTQAAVIASGLSLVLSVLAQPQRPIRQRSTLFCWAFFLGMLLLAAAFSPYSPIEGIKELWRWSAAALTWLLLVLFISQEWQRLLLALSLLLGPLINASLGLFQFWTGDGPPSFEIAGRFVRAYGSYGQPNSFAGYLNHAWPLALALAIGASVALFSHKSLISFRSDHLTRPHGHTNLEDRLLTKRAPEKGFFVGLRAPAGSLPAVSAVLLALGLWFVVAILLAALLASFSRGAWLGAACGLLVMLLVQGGRLRWLGIAALVAAGALLVLGGTSLLPSALTSRLESITGAFRFFDPGSVKVTPQNFAVVERMAQLWAGWQMALAHPLLGVGPGNYTLAYQDVAAAPWFASRGHAHNYYLHIAAEAGILGLVAYLSLIGSVCFSVFRALHQPQLSLLQRSILVGSCGMIAAVAAHSLFENLHVLHMPIQMVATWALAQSLLKYE